MDSIDTLIYMTAGCAAKAHLVIIPPLALRRTVLAVTLAYPGRGDGVGGHIVIVVHPNVIRSQIC